MQTLDRQRIQAAYSAMVDASSQSAAEIEGVPGTYNLAGLAHASLSDMIRSRRLRGGNVVVEARLADMLGISRTPLREALQRLEGEGLVVK